MARTSARAPRATSARVPFVVVIPARHASTRLPGKPLADIAGKPMIAHVGQRARESGAEAVYIATDHDGVRDASLAHGFDTVMTSPQHASGTDRIAEVVAHLGISPHTIVVNVQGDEPLIAPGLIREVAELLASDADASMSTACHRIRDAAELFNPNAVKVVLDGAGRALYFSRAPMPWPRDDFAEAFARAPGRLPASLPRDLPAYRHIGIYAYRASFLAQFAQLQPAPLERVEALEQLRALWNGHRIAVAIRRAVPQAGVDTPEDLARVRAVLGKSATRRAGAGRGKRGVGKQD